MISFKVIYFGSKPGLEIFMGHFWMQQNTAIFVYSGFMSAPISANLGAYIQTSQELGMLSSVTLNCHNTMNVMN